MLLGISIVAIYDKYILGVYEKLQQQFNKLLVLKYRTGLATVIILIGLFVFSAIQYLRKDKHHNYVTSPYFSCVPAISAMINPNTLILCSGAPRQDRTGYKIAYNKSYFFYWLNLKGYNVPDEDQSVEGVLRYKALNVKYFIAEKVSLNLKPGLKQELDTRFKNLLECNGIVLYDLSVSKLVNK